MDEGLLSLVFILVTFHFSESYIVYKTMGIDCDPNPLYITNTTCRLKAINRYKAVANMDCFIRDSLNNVTMHFESFERNAANLYKPFIIKASMNVCDFLNKKKAPVVGAFLINLLKRVSNLNHTCPYTGWLFVQGLYLDERILPLSVPIGRYKGKFRFVDYPDKEIGTVSIHLQSIEVRADDRVIKKTLAGKN